MCAEFKYPAAHAHVLQGELTRLCYDLNHGISPNKEANTFYTGPSPYQIKNETLLHLVIRLLCFENNKGLKNVNCMVLLLQHGANPNLIVTTTKEKPRQTSTQDTALTLAIKAKKGDFLYTSPVKQLFNNAQEKIQVDMVLNNMSALMIAVRYNNIEAIQLLLKNGANVNQTWIGQESNPLSLALNLPDRSEIISVLLANGARAFTRITDLDRPAELSGETKEIASIDTKRALEKIKAGMESQHENLTPSKP